MLGKLAQWSLEQGTGEGAGYGPQAPISRMYHHGHMPLL